MTFENEIFEGGSLPLQLGPKAVEVTEKPAFRAIKRRLRDRFFGVWRGFCTPNGVFCVNGI